MQRVLAFIIGIPLLVALGWLTYLTIRKYLDDLKEKDFNAVEILGERDRLLTEVAKYVLDAEGGIAERFNPRRIYLLVKFRS